MNQNLLVTPPQRSSSIRLRSRRDEVKQNFLKNRRSGEFGYGLNCDGGENINEPDEATRTKVDTLDPGHATGSIQHNLRPLLRDKYNSKQSDLKDNSSQENGERCFTR